MPFSPTVGKRVFAPLLILLFISSGCVTATTVDVAEPTAAASSVVQAEAEPALLSSSPYNEGAVLRTTAASTGFGSGTTLYYMDGGVSDEQIHALHFESGVTRQLTSLDGGGLRFGSGQVVPAPDASRLAFAIKNSPTEQIVAVGASVETGKTIATRPNHGPVVWTTDSTAVMFQDEDEIVRVDVATEVREVLMKSDARPRLIGATADWVAYAECPDKCTVTLIDQAGIEELASFEVISTLGDSITLGPDGRYLFAMQGRTRELQIIEIVGVEATEVERVFAGGSSTAPQPSPDGAFVAYDAWAGAPINVVNIADTSETNGLFLGAEGFLSTSVWMADSQGLVVGQDLQQGGGSKLLLVTIDDTVIKLGVMGTPIAVISGDPEGLAGQ